MFNLFKRAVNFYRSARRNQSLAADMRYGNISYSQQAEDLILERFFENKPEGFYVDIGAHHPRRFSNTFKFYRKGWHGINVDATPGSMELFEVERERDINLELGVAECKGEMSYYLFDEPALNTFSRERVNFLTSTTSYKLIKVLPVKTLPLADLLADYLPEGIEIDFLTIDVEGMDLEILKTNDWERFRPHVIIVEDIVFGSNVTTSKIYQHLTSVGYIFFSKAFNSLFFSDSICSPKN